MNLFWGVQKNNFVFKGKPHCQLGRESVSVCFNKNMFEEGKLSKERFLGDMLFS